VSEAPVTPYSGDLAGREPTAAMRETTASIEHMVSGWTPPQFEGRYAPGKWSARQILTHLAQTELALGTRVRMALATPNFVAQPFDQDAWMARESAFGGPEALQAYAAVSRMNVALYTSLSDAERQTPFSHPEYGALTVDWVIHQTAGHQIHHLKQLQIVVSRR
jgi:DinB superfamily